MYRLHRETFYLAIDYVDRYLSKQRNIPKTRLQLVGVTALFVAAKTEVRHIFFLFTYSRPSKSAILLPGSNRS